MLTPKQALFVKEYLVDMNGTQAAIRAGYSERTANEQASRLLANASIREAVAENSKARAAKVDITAEYVLQTIKNTIERCAQAEPVLDRDGAPTGEYKFDSAAVLKGTEQLGKYLKLFTDKVSIGGADDLPPVSSVINISGLSTSALAEILALQDAANRR